MAEPLKSLSSALGVFSPSWFFGGSVTGSSGPSVESDGLIDIAQLSLCISRTIVIERGFPLRRFRVGDDGDWEFCDLEGNSMCVEWKGGYTLTRRGYATRPIHDAKVSRHLRPANWLLTFVNFLLRHSQIAEPKWSLFLFIITFLSFINFFNSQYLLFYLTFFCTVFIWPRQNNPPIYFHYHFPVKCG